MSRSPRRPAAEPAARSAAEGAAPPPAAASPSAPSASRPPASRPPASQLPASPASAPAAPGLAIVVLGALAVLVTAADTYVIVLALPDILTGIGIGLDELQRATPIIGGFLLGYTATLPLLGRLADLRGRAPVLIGCLLLFAFGSLLTATATSLGPAVAGRGLQGVGAGGLVPATLALVADRWPPERRALPLGVVGAVQEAGAVLGPLAGAAVLAFADWRAIFWINLLLGLGLAAGVLVTGRVRRPDPVGLTLAALALVALGLQLAAPAALAEDVTLGLLWVPLVAAVPASTPLVVVLVVAGAAALVRSVVHPAGAVLPLRGLGRLAREVDVLGSALVVVALGALVWAFAAADTATEVIADGPVLLPIAAVAAVAFVVRERRTAEPVLPLADLRPPGAWGAMLVNLLVGVALVAALVDIPLFARETTTPGDQLGAALVLVRMLIAVPAGAVLGGWLARLVPPRLVAGGGMLLATLALFDMTTWGERTLDGAWSYVVLIVAGLGFGLAIAPVNTVLLAVTGRAVHGSASALAVVARTVGMLVGLSLLTAVALRRFTEQIQAIGSPVQLCPQTPTHCPAYDRATDAAILLQLHTVFFGAAIAAALAAVAALVLLRMPRPALLRA